MDKLNEVFKATLAVFHGIIATWLFLNFSERQVDQFYFLILLVFFSVANILLWHAIHRLSRWLRRLPNVDTPFDVQTIRYRPVDVIGLTVIAVSLGLFSAFLDRKDVVLSLASTVVDWHRTRTDDPFAATMFDITSNSTAALDKRSSQLVEAAREKGAYIRVFAKDAKLGYEGYPGRASTKGDVNEREVVLTPACRFSIDGSDPTLIKSMQRIEGPGVFLRLAEIGAIEIIDAYQSPCANLPVSTKK